MGLSHIEDYCVVDAGIGVNLGGSYVSLSSDGVESGISIQPSFVLGCLKLLARQQKRAKIRMGAWEGAPTPKTSTNTTGAGLFEQYPEQETHTRTGCRFLCIGWVNPVARWSYHAV